MNWLWYLLIGVIALLIVWRIVRMIAKKIYTGQGLLSQAKQTLSDLGSCCTKWFGGA